MKKLITLILFFSFCQAFAQTKVGGVVVDEAGITVPFANVLFKNSQQGTITNDDGRFYLESENTYSDLVISFIGYQTKTISLNQKVNYEMKIVLVEASEQLDEVVLIGGKQSKKNNPAIDILRKIWEKKRENGLRMFDQYAFDKYEKVEFDLNTIDSSVISSRIFKGLEFMFEDLDTSRITGKTYLPIFLNEKFSKVFGDNTMSVEKEDILGSKNSGFENNQSITAFVQDMYAEYDVYNNYIKFFDKSFYQSAFENWNRYL